MDTYGLLTDLDKSAAFCKAVEQTHGMEPIKVELCPDCTACPSVEITDAGVTIGEDENTVRLTHVEWNDLVAGIRSGQLNEVATRR